MNQGVSPKFAPHITIRVSGKLFQGHLAYLEHLVHSAFECKLWPVLSLANLEDVDSAALIYLTDSEGRDFSIVSCPDFVRQRMNDEGRHNAA